MSKGYYSVNLHGCANGVIPIPVIGENGNWYLGNENTEVPARGDQGEPGPTGAQGPQGLKGDTPELVTHLLETVTGKALDATMGRTLNETLTAKADKDDLIAINNKIAQLNSQLSHNIFYAGNATLKLKEWVSLRQNKPLPNSGGLVMIAMQVGTEKYNLVLDTTDDAQGFYAGYNSINNFYLLFKVNGSYLEVRLEEFKGYTMEAFASTNFYVHSYGFVK